MKIILGHVVGALAETQSRAPGGATGWLAKIKQAAHGSADRVTIDAKGGGVDVAAERMAAHRAIDRFFNSFASDA